MNTKKFIFLFLFLSLISFFFQTALPSHTVYPPLISKSYPLSTPLAFWASALGMRRVAGNIVWIQAMQYYGQRPEDKTGPSGRLYPQLKNHWKQLIRIDPYMFSVYLSGPAILAWNLNRHQEALELIEEALKALDSVDRLAPKPGLRDVVDHHPHIMGGKPFIKELRERLYILKSAVIFMEQDKLEEAISLLEEIRTRPDIPHEIIIMLAQMYTRAGVYQKAYEMWRDIYEKAEREEERQRALRQMGLLNERIKFSD